ncbi:response regulator [Paraburkholderia rhizosphaerae]|nr:response regulator transcription factor [Paraburkholderia rhizosphaerae]
METGIVTVYLVEDASQVRRNIALLLEMIAGVQVVGEAEDSETALGEISARRPDVAIIDLWLSSGSGIELISALSHALPDVVTIAFTNHSGPAFRAACKTAGVHYFFDKTTEIDAACRTIETLVSARR